MNLQLAKGVRDVPPEEKLLQNKIVRTLQEVFEIYGFTPLETPIFERYETLTAKGGVGAGTDTFNETFKFTDQGGRQLGLRFELTTSLARYVGTNPSLKLPFKRYEIGPVFRDGPIKLGRYRQFWQCDIDTLGAKSMLAEAEILAVVQKVFEQLNLEVIIKINNRKLLNGLLEEAGLKEREEALIVLDKLNKIGAEGVKKELAALGIKKAASEKLFELLSEKNSLENLSKKIKSTIGQEGLKELNELFSYLKMMGVNNYQLDLSLARGLAYYTGTIYEVYLKKGVVTSALAGGGRWDQMIGKFVGGGREIPAVGIAFGLAPIMDTLVAEKKLAEKTPAQIYVLPIKTLKESLKLAEELRTQGIKTDFDLTERGVGKGLEYASALGIPYVLLIGENELAKKKVLLRNMQNGDQQLLALADVVKKLKK